MTAQTIDAALSQVAENFEAAATAAAAALGLETTLEIADVHHGVADALGRPGTLAATMTVAGPVQGELVLVTTEELDPALDDRELGGLTAMSPRARALRSAADVLGTRHGDPTEGDPGDTSADLAAVMTLDGQVVGILALRVTREATPEPAAPAQTHPAADAELPAVTPIPTPTAEQQRDSGFRSSVPSGGSAGLGPVATRLDQLTHVEMEVTVEIGRTRMTVGALLGLAPGQVVELDRAAGAPVDLFVNGTLLARGEVVVIDEDFGFRVTEIVSSRES
jgi:flagellar motor switch protein FliN/FliY